MARIFLPMCYIIMTPYTAMTTTENHLKCTAQESLKLRQHDKPTFFNPVTKQHWAMKKDVELLRDALLVTRFAYLLFNPYTLLIIKQYTK